MKSLRMWIRMQAACLLCLAAWNARGGEAVLLKAKWRAGERSFVQMTNEQQTKTKVPGQEKPITQDISMVFYLIVEVTGAAEGGGYKVAIEYSDIAVDMTMQGQTFAFDSRKEGEQTQDPNNPMAKVLSKVFGSMVGGRFLCTLGPDGKITKVEGVKEFAEKVLNANPNPQARQMVAGMLNEDMLKQNFAANLEHQWLPEKPVKIGDSWTHEQKLPLGPLGNLAIELKYTFTRWESIEGVRCVALEFAGTMAGTPPKAQQPQAQMRFNSFDGSLDGTTWFDPEAGQMVKSTTTQDMQMNMTMTIPNQGEQSISTDVRQMVTVELVATEDIKEE